jgi:hypothetical protein
MAWFDTIGDLDSGRDVVRRRRYGVIEASCGRLVAVHFRPWPKVISLPEVFLAQGLRRRRWVGDRCRVYFNQPRRHQNFLSITFAISTHDCTLKTLHAAREALEAIAEIKQSDALLCDAWNARISQRLLERWGWEPHCPSRWHRNFIRRFYGRFSSDASTDSMQLTAAESPTDYLRLRR